MDSSMVHDPADEKNQMAAQERFADVTGMTCVNPEISYEEECHTNIVSTFVPHQEEDCMKVYKKVRL